MSNIAIIIPFYNGDNFILNCLQSIYSNPEINLKTYIVDNSTKPSKIGEISQSFKNVRILKINPKSGFGKACTHGTNQAIADGAKTIILLNQDATIDPQCIKRLCEALDNHPEIGIAAPVQMTYDHKEIESFFVRHYLTQCPELIFDSLNNSLKETYNLERASGACMAIRTALIAEIGLFDPLFFMYHEDEDLCRRVSYTGLMVALVPTAIIFHAHSHTNSDRVTQEKIAYFKRTTSTIYQLKNLDRPFVSLAFRIFLQHLSEYFSDLLYLRFRKIMNDFLADLHLIPKLGKIQKSRSFELRLRQRIVKSASTSTQFP